MGEVIRRGLRILVRTGLLLGVLYLGVGFLVTRIDRAPRLYPESAVVRAPLDAVDPLLPITARGAVSVHSGRSHDAEGTFDEIARAAEASGLDFVVLGDHPGRWIEAPDPLRPRRISETLIIPGVEMSVAEHGRLLLTGVDTLPNLWGGELGDLIDRVDRVTGFASVVHPRSSRESERWSGREVEGLHGWESLDLSEMVRARISEPWAGLYLTEFLTALPFGRGDRTLARLWQEEGSTPAVLAFDSVRAEGPAALTGGLNHHPKFRVGGALVPGYAPSFRAVANHLLLPAPLAEDPRRARPQVAEALRAGRLFVTLGYADRATGFRSWIEDGSGRVLRFGEVGVHRPGDRLAVRIPDRAPGRVLVRVVRDGVELGFIPAEAGEGLSLPLPGPGVYRVELHHAGIGLPGLRFDFRPWILGNPIEVTGRGPRPTPLQLADAESLDDGTPRP